MVYQCKGPREKKIKYELNHNIRKIGDQKGVCMSETLDRVKTIIVSQLGVDENEVKTESSFVDDLGADSLDVVELVMALEEEFDLEIPDEDAERINTVAEIISYLEEKNGS